MVLPGLCQSQLIIKESCVYCVDIASQLPAFTERTFAEVLKREDQIVARTEEILHELQQFRQQLDPMVENETLQIEDHPERFEPIENKPCSAF